MSEESCSEGFLQNARKQVIDEFLAVMLPEILKINCKFIQEPDEDKEYDFVNGNRICQQGNNACGTYLWGNGSAYTGSIINNQATGEGKVIYCNGNIYEGSFFAGQRHGYGKYRSMRKYEYCGNFVFGKFEGCGFIEFEGRGTFTGSFKNGRPSEGKHIFKTGIYNGSFDDGGKRKKGLLQFLNGDTYEGSWTGDMFCDYGIYQWCNVCSPSMKIILPTAFTGFWLDCKKHSVGKLEFDEITIACVWQDNIKNGPGLMISAPGDWYAGNPMYNNNVYLAENCRKIRKCPESKIIVEKALEFITYQGSLPQSQDNAFFETRQDMFTNQIALLLKSFTHVSAEQSLMYPGLIPNYYLDNLPLFQRCLVQNYQTELKYLQTIVKENYSKFVEIYARYAKLSYLSASLERGDGNDFYMSHIGLWYLYRDVFHNSFDVNIFECIQNAYQIYNIWPLGCSRVEAQVPVQFCAFLRHFFYITSLIMIDENMKRYASKCRPTFFGQFAVETLIVLRIFDNLCLNNSHGHISRVIFEDQFYAFKLFKIIFDFNETDLEHDNIRMLFRFIRSKKISPSDGSLVEMVRKFFPPMANGNTKPILLYKTEFKLTLLECAEIVAAVLSKFQQNETEEDLYTVHEEIEVEDSFSKCT